MRNVVPIIDIFAGPGGLSEGFSSYRPAGRTNRIFKVLLSVEKDAEAHRTLELRAFFREFNRDRVPDAYYQYLRGEIDRNTLFKQSPVEYKSACSEALRAELGKDDAIIYLQIERQLKKYEGRPWVLIGGPPCQAYSVAARSANAAVETDSRQVLYQNYLKIIARFRPTVFVMENVKGILSSKVRLDENALPHAGGTQELIFQRILRDLKHPAFAVNELTISPVPKIEMLPDPASTYTLYSLVVPIGNDQETQPYDFIIRSENYGIPQTRHRVIIVGVRNDLGKVPVTLTSHEGKISVKEAIGDLPHLRSRLSLNSGLTDSEGAWKKEIRRILEYDFIDNFNPAMRNVQLELFHNGDFPGNSSNLFDAIRDAVEHIEHHAIVGGNFIPSIATAAVLPEWYTDTRMGGVCNHESRAHIGADLHRYLYLACFAKIYGITAFMNQFPEELLPDHKNIKERKADAEEVFDDRFRVQVGHSPATTITSHIAKDGHYNVHYDPYQCRSLTVREAARLQTFPDNYFFEGSRTQQYIQVGNAVPPLLARQIAEVVYGLLDTNHGS